MVQTKSDALAARRALIDLIATTRARCLRLELLGYKVTASDISCVNDRQTCEDLLLAIRENSDVLRRICQILHGKDPKKEIEPALCDWVAAYAKTEPQIISQLDRLFDLGDALHKSAGKDPTAFQSTLADLTAFGKGPFFKCVTEFCDGLWKTIDSDRVREVERASAAGQTISSTLLRLEAIGKHVRLVSLNATVEAARLGEAGRGITLIATEFKSLAEEIQTLSVTARTDISSIHSGEP